MKGSNGEASIGKIRSRLPRVLRRIVAHPIHQIVEFAAPKSGIEDRINLELRQPVHLDGQRDLHDATRERVRHMRLQEADMKYGMDVHRRRQLEAKRRGADLTNDGEGPKTTNVQF